MLYAFLFALPISFSLKLYSVGWILSRLYIALSSQKSEHVPHSIRQIPGRNNIEVAFGLDEVAGIADSNTSRYTTECTIQRPTMVPHCIHWHLESIFRKYGTVIAEYFIEIIWNISHDWIVPCFFVENGIMINHTRYEILRSLTIQCDAVKSGKFLPTFRCLNLEGKIVLIYTGPYPRR
jgi:hypothetical protein